MKRATLLVLCLISLSWALPLAHAEKDEELKARKEQVSQLILTRLTEDLSLNEEKSRQLGVILQKYREKRKELRRELRQVKYQLSQSAKSDKNQELQPALTRFQEIRDQMDRLDEAMFAEVKPLLTLEQQARFVLTMEEIRHEIRAVRARHPHHRGGYGPVSPGANPSGGALNTFQDKSSQ
jgi:Spy/CpxP family protein refolding chaperone